MKKLFCRLTFAFVLFGLSGTYMFANENEASKQEFSAEYYAERLNNGNFIDKVIVPKSIKFKNNEVQLLIEFEDSDRALTNFKTQYKKELDFIQTKYNLDDLNDASYKEYYNNLMTDSNEEISADAMGEILAFFDIFENKFQNEEIELNMMLYEIDEKEKYLENIDVLTSSYTDTVSVVGENTFIKNQSRISLPNVNAAVNYAKKYATSRNSSFASYGSADCTNFVSQILLASGVNTVKPNGNNENYGWWYVSKNIRSISWINADTFSRYMGRQKYNSWISLVSNISRGSFIAADFGGDGKVDHAFITDKSGSNVQIAQHSTDYLKWSYNTGWPKDNGKRILYKVR